MFPILGAPPSWCPWLRRGRMTLLPLTHQGPCPEIESDTDSINSYYVLIAACILARKTEWLRNACLAAALIFPAIAAVHGIVLAALHLDGTLPSPR